MPQSTGSPLILLNDIQLLGGGENKSSCAERTMKPLGPNDLYSFRSPL